MATRRLSGIATSSSVPDNGGDHSGGGGGAGGYVDDVFSTYVYTGNGADRDIENGVDLAGEGGLVWLKNRSFGLGHALFDTERGAKVQLQSDNTGEQWTYNNSLTSFNSDGFSLGNGEPNRSGDDHVSWTFRKQPGFFDVVTFDATGAGTSLTIPHNLGSVPAMIIIKSVSQAGNWEVYHKDLGPGNVIYLNHADASSSNAGFFPTAPDENVFHIGAPQRQAQMVAYLFAHDDSDESMIKCGSYTGNGSSNGPEIDLGFEPQWVLIKSTGGDSWVIYDAMRGIVTGGNDNGLSPDNYIPEVTTADRIDLTSTGFKITGSSGQVNDNTVAYIYMAIRRPNKPAEEFEPEELFAVDIDNDPARHGFTTGFVTDMGLAKKITGSSESYLGSRPTAGKVLDPISTSAEVSSHAWSWDQMDGFFKRSGIFTDYVGYGWRRAPGFFDVVAYGGTGVAGLEVPHNLGVAPEMMWIKRRDYDNGSMNWIVYHKDITENRSLNLNTNGYVGQFDETFFNNTAPTDTYFTLGPNFEVNYSGGGTHIAYLFASTPGISKVGIYTGTGTDLDIDCEFTTGARFVLIKRTDDTGDWMFFDTERGITSSGSPMLKLNENEAQASGSYIKPHSKGFTATSNLASIDGAEYIFYAIA